MAVFVLDASVAVPWCARDEASAWTDSLLKRLQSGDSALVPPLWAYEIANSLLQIKRRGRITTEQMSSFLDDLRALPIQVDSEGVERVFDRVSALADRCRLTVYDAAYLELSLRTGNPLATLDAELESAALAEGALLIPRP